jgi:serine/threonine protein kinase
MSADSLGSEEVPVSVADRIDLACDQFEAAWNAGREPRIESFLAGWSGRDRSALLSELVDLEISLCQARGEQASRRDYAERFAREGFEVDPDATGNTPHRPDTQASRSRAKAQTPPYGPGSRIGRYKLLQQIGEGGMGVVYMAEQEKPVRRRVALKIVKPGMNTGRVIARFEAERQALALMDHPNIARVLDAGTTGEDLRRGVPYFVMDLVRGVPITQYCDEARLSPRERLELFAPVCQAIQHAHQKGIIHRDIKPSNVMVTLIDGKPVPKVIDFGVAKATEQRLTERTMFTEYGAMIGTPEYMSPEQADLSGLDVDTRGDVYSLGVLLYELLTGSTPLDRTTLRAAGYDEILRRIKHEEPPKPSTRISHSGDLLASIAALRRIEPARLTKLVRGELDWIVMKALEKERSRRYETANGLSRDIQRYLDGDPVEAGPPSAVYRLKKFVHSHRAALAVASLFVGMLLAGVLVSSALAVRALRAESALRHALALLQEEHGKTKAELVQVEAALAAEREGIFLRYDVGNREWIRLTAATKLATSDRVLCLTPFRALVTLGKTQITLVGQTEIRVLSQPSDDVPALELVYGRVLIRQSQASSLKVNFAGRTVRLAIEPNSSIGLERIERRTHGQAGTKGFPLMVYCSQGKAVLSLEKQNETLTSTIAAIVETNAPIKQAAADTLPIWVVEPGPSAPEVELSEQFLRVFHPDRPVLTDMVSAIEDDRLAVKSLAIAGIEALGELSLLMPILTRKDDPIARRFAISAVRDYMGRSPEAAKEVHDQLVQEPGIGEQQTPLVEKMLVGYSSQEASKPELFKQLVGLLSADQESVGVRELAMDELKRLTGRDDLGYSADHPEGSGLSAWKELLSRGDLKIKTLPRLPR